VDSDSFTALRGRLAALFLTRPAAEWEAVGTTAGVPLCRVRTASEWVADDHARESGEVVEVDDPEFGPVWMAGSPLGFSETPGAASAPRHAPGADRAGILADSTAEAPERPMSARPAPENPTSAAQRVGELRVVDLTQILAGPSAGRILAEYGADVIKVNAPQRPIEAHGIVNRGKRSILIDLQQTEGLALLWQLIDTADVVTQNFPQGTAERYGVGYRHVHARRPDAVYVSVSCYGYGGPLGRGRGYEVQGQAVTGMMERAGRGGVPAVLGPYNPLDYGTGAMAGFGAMVALFHRARTGEGQHVWTSLAHVGTFHQSTLLVGTAAAAADRGGRELLGISALQRFYRAQDEWFFLGAAPGQAMALAAALGVDATSAASLDEVSIAAAVVEHSASHWVELLHSAGIGAHRVVRLPELLEDAYVAASGLRLEQESPEVGAVVMPGPVITVNGARLAAGRVAGAPGSDALAILAEVGREGDAAELEAGWIIQSAAAPAGWPTS